MACKSDPKDGTDVSGVTTVAIPFPSLVPPPPSTQFCRIDEETDLRDAPKNWLLPLQLSTEGPNLNRFSGFDGTRHYTGFSSFRMASMFLESGRQFNSGRMEGVDVISDAENIKQLLRLPFNRKGVLSMVVHRVGKTLLIDDLDVPRLLRNMEWKWLQEFFFNVVLKSIESRDRVLVRRRTTRSDAIQERNLISKFLYRSVKQPDAQLNVAASSASAVAQPSKAGVIQQQLPPLPKLNPDDFGVPDSKPHEFARTFLWNFEDIRMLIGSDMPIFGDEEHPSVSLRLHSSQKPINILTGLDYWLDNLMCQVPEVLMCFHVNGIVQKYELIKTEDLPKLSEHCKFDPRVVLDVAQNVLSFLKTNATKVGHTYWLFKAKGDEVVKLYDLTSICEETNFSPTVDEGKVEEAPFKTAVAMLLFKVARNMLQSSTEHLNTGTAQKLLEKCLELLDKKKYPQIATSTHFMLSDIYFPDDIDPTDPEIHQTSNVDSPCRKFKLEDEADDVADACTVPMVEVNSLLEPSRQHELFREDCLPAVRPQFPKGAIQRCKEGLSHVVDGLGFLKQFSERQHEQKVNDEKARERFERDHPKMSKPDEPIPMPDGATGGGGGGGGAVSPAKSTPNKTELSWHQHLKMVLLKKAGIVYTVLSENHFISKNYGHVLRYVKRSLNCYEMVFQLQGVPSKLAAASQQTVIVSFVYGVAADAYMNMVKSWENVITYQEQFNMVSNEDDVAISDFIEEHVGEEHREWSIKVPKDLEECMNLGIRCYNMALKWCVDTEEGEKSSLIKRRGNAQNEIGVFYMTHGGRIVQSLIKEEKTKSMCETVEQMLNRSLMYFNEGAKDFEAVKDNRNKALILFNASKLARIKAYFFTETKWEGSSYYRDAEQMNADNQQFKDILSYLRHALDAIGPRKNSPYLYDQITLNMCRNHFRFATFLLDNLHRKEKLKVSYDDLVKEVIDTLQKAYRHLELENRNREAKASWMQVGATILNRVAGVYHSWIGPASDENTRRKCKLFSELNYKKSTDLFNKIKRWDKSFRNQVERVCLHEYQEEDGKGFGGTKKMFLDVFAIYVEDILPILEKLHTDQHRDKVAENGSEEIGLASLEEEMDSLNIDDHDPEEKSYSLNQVCLKRLSENVKLMIKTLTILKERRPTTKKTASIEKQIEVVKRIFLKTLRLDPKGESFVGQLIGVLTELKSELPALSR